MPYEVIKKKKKKGEKRKRKLQVDNNAELGFCKLFVYDRMFRSVCLCALEGIVISRLNLLCIIDTHGVLIMAIYRGLSDHARSAFGASAVSNYGGNELLS